ncbi:group II intron maturase-specific domain-containing protein [Nocardia sp. CWNU-33]|uniref:group II intron maturase-specific domain-containing protein n=1 Tax=Nocardia sp. CWNU-33 TaxID=3392117 RepID=UPI00398E94D2
MGCAVSSKTFSSLDSHLWTLTHRWARRSHPAKPKKWVVARYFGRFHRFRNDQATKAGRAPWLTAWRNATVWDFPEARVTGTRPVSAASWSKLLACSKDRTDLADDLGQVEPPDSRQIGQQLSVGMPVHSLGDRCVDLIEAGLDRAHECGLCADCRAITGLGSRLAAVGASCSRASSSAPERRPL